MVLRELKELKELREFFDLKVKVWHAIKELKTLVLVLLCAWVLPLAAYCQNDKDSLTKADHTRLWAVKTNLLLWGVLAPNVEVEVPLGMTNRWSIEGEIFFPWWTWNRNTYATQALNFGAELRYWLGNRDNQSTLNGWHIGLALAGGYYDIEWKRSDGYQGEHLNTYINIGYQHRFGGHWAVDGGLGIGLLATKYRHYAGSSTYPAGHEEQNDDHLIWKENGHLNLLAATHANISIAYLFDVQSIIPKQWRKKP